ncbi:homeobox protein Hox-B5b-like [Morone saxatilis]|uniref:homeobox protein Hox-B5b-like n=1 Tax=Morone saxatilis TaxID=34816 RepID=UPI0015E2517A|nr:homeobox protein Hox-B5b-like [Morone saxatilis]
MSSYFVNSFSGRYPNGSDYQLLNYGTNGAVSGSFRDPGTMHSGSFGYNYNGMDLTVNRTNTGSHFGAVREDARGFAPDARYRQTPNCSLSSPDPVPPSCATASREPLELKSPSPPSDRSATSGGNNLNKSNSAHFTEIEDATVASETEEGAHSSGGSSTAPRAQQQQQQLKAQGLYYRHEWMILGIGVADMFWQDEGKEPRCVTDPREPQLPSGDSAGYFPPLLAVCTCQLPPLTSPVYKQRPPQALPVLLQMTISQVDLYFYLCAHS